MTIPVIILNYNTHNDCAKCISFLQRQKGVDLEIIIVDNNSSIDDLTALRVICSDTKCTLLESKENRGYNAGNNIGLRYAAQKGYTYALIANPDMEFPQENYIATLVNTIEQEANAVVVASDIVTPEGVHQNPIQRDDNWLSSWAWIYHFFGYRSTDTYDFIDDYTRSHVCYKVSGCCLLLRIDFLKKIDFFDEGVFLYCEEAILSKQVEHTGHTMYYTPEVYALHRHIKTKKGNPLFRLQHWKNSRYYFIDRYSSYNEWGKLGAKFSFITYITLLKLYNYWKGFKKQ
ncbi:MAG: glycosyltransferase family 2 protein [Bacteroidales bacterium]|nr:glycosyltransferase family 2 protein [Bacteroidales bacterium]